MSKLSLIDIKVEKISFVNDVQTPGNTGPVNVNIGTRITSVVNYDPSNTKCKCSTTVEFTPDLPVDFEAKIEVVGIFNCEDIQDRKEAHAAACKMLFPHVQVKTSAFMNMVGFPNFIIGEPKIDMDSITEVSDG